ncbi:hypothetical protein Kfla_3737 [Kribbella flavida DSM 17836]|uniref:Basic secretory peptidase family protein n=1 Tax=Kribbella flavida (strain DSM 17836 / JCM 10339 / NBRC 14399) TaxID=479435 RepID=D2PNX4_KRIFD|nr:hypothetical protein [Kribbella flavida]ADB32792.1 hypothetical protein Kfla_3737 [Kribbella flavida DSM 17836]
MKHPGRLLAGVAALALAAAAGVVVSRSGDGAGPSGGTAAALQASGSPTPAALTDAQKTARAREVDVLLARRATAVLKGDLKGFLASVDAKQPRLVARQRTLFGNLRKFGFSSLQYFTADSWDAPQLAQKHGPTTYSTRVMMRYRIAGLDAKPVQTDLGYTFVRRGALWILVEDGGIDEILTRDGHRQPWDFQEVAVVRRGKVVVVVDRRETGLGRKVAKVSEDAANAVRRHWPRSWNGSVMVVAMAEPRVMATLWTSGNGRGWTIAAKAVTLYEGEQLGKRFGPPVGSRIVVNPAMRKDLEQDLLVHEMTHVATVPIGPRAPLWLVEGLAEYVRCHAIEDDPQWTVDPYRRTVRSKYLPGMTSLPDRETFDQDGDKAYGQSWWTVEYLASRLGTKKLAALYADLAVHSTSTAAYTAILTKHTGKTPAELTAAVRKYRG